MRRILWMTCALAFAWPLTAVATEPVEKAVAGLVADLASPQWKTRNRAERILALVAGSSRERLARLAADASGNPEQRARLEKALSGEGRYDRVWITDAFVADVVSASRGWTAIDLAGARQLTDAGLASVARLTRLERLDLSAAVKITGAGLKHLRACEKLVALDLSGCAGIADADLAGLRQLRVLAAPPGITDAGLARLATLEKLRDLDLSGCQKITAAGVKVLGTSKSLERIDLTGCRGMTASAGDKRITRKATAPDPEKRGSLRLAVECRNNLKQLGLGIHLHMMNKGDKLPAHGNMLRALRKFSKQFDNDRIVRCPCSPAPGSRSQLRGAAGPGYLDGPPVYSRSRSSERPMLWCPPGTHAGGPCVLFLDGHVEQMSVKRFTTVMNQLRKRVAGHKATGKKPLH